MSSPAPKRKVGHGSSPTASVASSDGESRVSRSSGASGPVSSKQSSRSEQSQPTSVDSATSFVSNASEVGKAENLSVLTLTLEEKNHLKSHMPKQCGKQFCLDFCSHSGCKKKQCPHLHASLPTKLAYTVQLFLLSKGGPKTGPRLTKSDSKTAQKAIRASSVYTTQKQELQKLVPKLSVPAQYLLEAKHPRDEDLET